VALYARHQIPETWVVDLARGVLHVYRRAEAGAYAEISDLAEPGVLRLAALPTVAVDLSGILRG